jgi:hypothetical protein
MGAWFYGSISLNNWHSIEKWWDHMSHDQLLHCYHVMCNNNKQISGNNNFNMGDFLKNIYWFIYLGGGGGGFWGLIKDKCETPWRDTSVLLGSRFQHLFNMCINWERERREREQGKEGWAGLMTCWDRNSRAPLPGNGTWGRHKHDHKWDGDSGGHVS